MNGQKPGGHKRIGESEQDEADLIAEVEARTPSSRSRAAVRPRDRRLSRRNRQARTRTSSPRISATRTRRRSTRRWRIGRSQSAPSAAAPARRKTASIPWKRRSAARPRTAPSIAARSGRIDGPPDRKPRLSISRRARFTCRSTCSGSSPRTVRGRRRGWSACCRMSPVWRRGIPTDDLHPVRHAADAGRDARMWRAYYEAWPETTRSYLDPRLLDLMPRSRISCRRPPSSTSRSIRPSTAASCRPACERGADGLIMTRRGNRHVRPRRGARGGRLRLPGYPGGGRRVQFLRRGPRFLPALFRGPLQPAGPGRLDRGRPRGVGIGARGAPFSVPRAGAALEALATSSPPRGRAIACDGACLEEVAHALSGVIPGLSGDPGAAGDVLSAPGLPAQGAGNDDGQQGVWRIHGPLGSPIAICTMALAARAGTELESDELAPPQ